MFSAPLPIALHPSTPPSGVSDAPFAERCTLVVCISAVMLQLLGIDPRLKSKVLFLLLLRSVLPSQLPTTSSPRMLLADVTTQCSHKSLDDVFPFPEQPFSKVDTFKMLKVSTEVAQCFLGDPATALAALFRPERENARARLLATEILERDKRMEQRVRGLSTTCQAFSTRKGQRFASTFGDRSQKHTNRPMISVSISLAILAFSSADVSRYS